jgi:hypothetical protein
MTSVKKVRVTPEADETVKATAKRYGLSYTGALNLIILKSNEQR